MSRSLADPLYERLLRSFPANQAYTRADWEGPEMPDPVAHFLGQLLRHYSRREARRLRRARSAWVDYDHPEMERAVRTFFNAVESHTRVPADEWEDTLRQATHHTTAHLVRPVHVLADFVFAERQEEVRLPEVLWRMNFFGAYAYLREAIHAFSKKRNLDALGPDRFERFLHRVDERLTTEYSADRWLHLLDPLFAIARRATGREQVPPALLQAFFAEKGRTAVQRRLQTYADEGHDGVSPRALHRLIEEAEQAGSVGGGTRRTTETNERARPPSDRSTPASAAPAEGDALDSGTPTDDEIWGVAGAARPEGHGDSQETVRREEDVPLWKQFQQGRTEPPSAATDGGAADSGRPNAEQEPLWARFRHERDERLSDAVTNEGSSAASGQDASRAGSTAPSGGSASSSAPGGRNLAMLEQTVLGVSNPPHRAVYVRQLFDGDQTAYRRVLQRLSAVESWGEASQVIASDIFRAHKVNIYSDAAVHFTNAVESRFRE